jgi:hypothetical protein
MTPFDQKTIRGAAFGTPFGTVAGFGPRGIERVRAVPGLDRMSSVWSRKAKPDSTFILTGRGRIR